MRRIGIGLALTILLIAGCQPSTPADPDETDPAPEATDAPAEPTEEPEATEAPPEPTEAPPPPIMELIVTGPEETVFDWSEVHCVHPLGPQNIPDAPTHAFRDASGRVQLIIAHDVNYRMIGPDLNTLEMDCNAPVMLSTFDPDPGMFSDGEWINSVYTEDGQTIYALVHNEYRGQLSSGSVSFRRLSDLPRRLDHDDDLHRRRRQLSTYCRAAQPPHRDTSHSV